MSIKRVVLKVSGEALGGAGETGLDLERIQFIATQFIEASSKGIELALVVGGGNFLRGGTFSGTGFPRVKADQMGMLATLINGMALREVICSLGGMAEVRSAVPVPGVVDAFRSEEVRGLLSAGNTVIFSGGTGNPFFTTDTACALRCCEIDADLFLKATKVDGVYSADPVADPSAKRYEKLTYEEVLDSRLGVMDLTAVELCRQNGIPIKVFDFLKPGNIVKAVEGEPVGTLIS